METLLHLATAFGLATAVGMDTTLPLLSVSLLAWWGAIALAPPFDRLGSAHMAAGLAGLALFDILGDRLPAVGAVKGVVWRYVTMGAGAILVGTQTGAVGAIHPDATIFLGMVAGGTVSGAIHRLRPATSRADGPARGCAGALALGLTYAALFKPALVLIGTALGATLLAAMLLLGFRALRGLFARHFTAAQRAKLREFLRILGRRSRSRVRLGRAYTVAPAPRAARDAHGGTAAQIGAGGTGGSPAGAGIYDWVD